MKKIVLLFLLLLASIGTSFAYDFSAVNSAGQTLYYNYVTSSSGRNVYVTYPNASGTDWSGYTQPTGSLTIPSSVTYGGRTYSVTSIGDWAFSRCGISSVTIPNSVTSIGNFTFYVCSGLTSVTIGSSVTSIGEYAFYGCTRLTGNLTIPNSVTNIGSNAFFACSGLSRVNYTGNIAGWCGISFSSSSANPLYYAHHLYIGDSEVTNLIIPNSVTSIGNYAFDYCIGLTSVTIPNSVTSIGGSAFSSCSRLTSVTIPNSVTSIGDYAFYGCRGLTSVTIPNSVTSIDDFTFYGCTGLTSVTIPNSVTSIGTNTFQYCSGLASVTIPYSVTSIGSYAFRNCSGLTSLTIPYSVTSIGISAFDGINTVIYCGSATGSPWGATHAGCYDTDGDFIYSDNTQTILVAYIGAGGNVTIPNTVSIINDYAFYGCTGLTSVTIPSSVAGINNHAFYDCTSLINIACQGSIPPILGSSAFTNVPATATVTVPCGSLSTYASNWTYFSDFQEGSDIYAFSATSADASMGSVTIQAMPSCANNGTAVVSATANVGYAFGMWNDFNTDNPRSVVPTSDMALTAYFFPVASAPDCDTTTYRLTVNVDNPTLGWAIGSGRYTPNESIWIYAGANSSEAPFLRWSDGSTQNPRHVTVTANATLTAIFTPGSGCPAITDFPYSENFDGYTNSTTTKTGVEPQCWELVHQYVTMTDEYKPMVYRGHAHSGSYSLILNKRGLYAMPEVEANVRTLRMTFYLEQTAAKYQLQVGVMTDKDDVSTFVPVQTINNSTTNSTQVTVNFSSYAGNGHYIAFKNILASGNSGDYSCNYLDDLTLSVASSSSKGADSDDPADGNNAGLDGNASLDPAANEVTVYPNPTTGKVTVDGLDIQRIELYDNSGRQLSATANDRELDLTALPAGAYTLRVTTSEGVEVRRVIKN